MITLMQQFKNAMAIIKQIKNGEWEFTGHYPYDFKPEFVCYTAERNGIELWVASGPLFCEIRDQPWQLGIFGFIVWYFGAGKRKKSLERKMRRKPSDLTK